MLPMLAAAAVWTAPLSVETTPAGATVSAVYARSKRVEQASCVTPCILTIPQQASIRLSVALEGYRVQTYPAVRWGYSLRSGFVLAPDHVRLVLTKED